METNIYNTKLVSLNLSMKYIFVLDLFGVIDV